MRGILIVSNQFYFYFDIGTPHLVPHYGAIDAINSTRSKKYLLP